MYEWIERNEVDFISTGIDKLDSLLEGGIPKGFFTLILGVPGSGFEILIKQIASNGNTLLFSTCETEEEIMSTMKRFGWNPENLEIVDIASEYAKRTLLVHGKRFSSYQKRIDLDLKELIAECSGGKPIERGEEEDFLNMLSKRFTDSRIPEKTIVHSLDFFLDQYQQSEIIKTIHIMKMSNMKKKGAVFVSLTKGVCGELFERKMESIADCVLELEVIRKGTSFDRYLAVKKMKNYARKIGVARYIIDESGFVLETVERIL